MTNHLFRGWFVIAALNQSHAAQGEAAGPLAAHTIGAMAVHHDADRHRFFVELGDYEAALMYAERDGVLDFYHIYVPDPYRNHGVAGRILRTAFDYAREHGYKVVPSCPFIADEFLPRFEQYQELVVPGAFPFAERH